MRAAVHSAVLEADIDARATHMSSRRALTPLTPALHVVDSDPGEALTDDDIIESTPVPISGFFSAMSRRDDSGISELPRCSSIVDGDELTYDGEGSTNVSDVVRNLASLLDARSVPRLSGHVVLDGLEPHEAWFVSIVTGNTPMSVLLETSPFADEETLRIVASLVSKRAITLFPGA